MRWFPMDPVVCDAARVWLERNNPLQAGRLLAESSDFEHQAVQQLAAELQPQLVDFARQALQQNQCGVAEEAVTLAERLAALSVEGARVKRDLESVRQTAILSEKWQDQCVQQAREWADSGRVVSALRLIEPLADAPQAGSLVRDLQHRAERLERYLELAELHLDAGELDGTRYRLEQARTIDAFHPRAVQLGAELARQEIALRKTMLQDRLENLDLRRQPGDTELVAHRLADGAFLAGDNSTSSARCPTLPEHASMTIRDTGNASHHSDVDEPNDSTRPQPIVRRTQSFDLEGTLVVSHDVVTLGNGNDSSVSLIFRGQLHRQHGELRREAGCYRVIPARDRHGRACEIRVNGKLVARDCVLKSGDELTFGNAACRWTFRRPVPGSATAILDQAAGSLLSAQPGGTAFVRSPLADEKPPTFRRIVLLADELTLGPRGWWPDFEPPAPMQPPHIGWVLENWPFGAGPLRLVWRNHQLGVEAENLYFNVETAGGGDLDTSAVHVPGQMTLWTPHVAAAESRESRLRGTLSLRLSGGWE